MKSESLLRHLEDAVKHPLMLKTSLNHGSKSLLNWEKERSWPFVLWGQEDTSKRRLSNWELLSNWEHFEYCYKSLIFLRQTHKFVRDSGSHLQGKKKKDTSGDDILEGINGLISRILTGLHWVTRGITKAIVITNAYLRR